MWIVRPRDNGDSVVNVENGHIFNIRSSVDAQGVRSWELVSYIPIPGVSSWVIMDGYKSYEDAKEAFKALLESMEIEPYEADDPTVVPADDEEEGGK